MDGKTEQNIQNLRDNYKGVDYSVILHVCNGKIPWRRKWQPTPVFLPGNPIDRGASWAIVHGITEESDMT